MHVRPTHEYQSRYYSIACMDPWILTKYPIVWETLAGSNLYCPTLLGVWPWDKKSRHVNLLFLLISTPYGLPNRPSNPHPTHCTKHIVMTNLPSIGVTYIFWMKSTLDENSQMSLDIAHMKVNFMSVHLGKIILRKASLLHDSFIVSHGIIAQKIYRK